MRSLKFSKWCERLIVAKIILIVATETDVISFKPIIATFSLIATTLNCHNKS